MSNHFFPDPASREMPPPKRGQPTYWLVYLLSEGRVWALCDRGGSGMGWSYDRTVHIWGNYILRSPLSVTLLRPIP